jgi:FkbM family methyltransferase
MYFDGEDWIYEFSEGAIAHHEFVSNPDLLISENIELFTKAYVPSKGDVVIDVGAGVGSELHFFSGRVGSTGRVFAIEADPDNFRRLQKTVSISNLSNVILINGAVSNENYLGFINQVDPSGLGNFISKNFAINSREVQVHNFRDLLNKFNLNEIDFMKINIEGEEFFALYGLAEKLREVKNICVSCHDFLPNPIMHTYISVAKLLLENDFTIRKHETVLDSPNKSWYLYGKRNFSEFLTLTWNNQTPKEIFEERDKARLEVGELRKTNEKLYRELNDVKNSHIWRFSSFYRSFKSIWK